MHFDLQIYIFTNKRNMKLSRNIYYYPNFENNKYSYRLFPISVTEKETVYITNGKTLDQMAIVHVYYLP